MTAAIKKLRLYFSNSQGFTLIELLVVIGILGILASALIATIDPFEQLKKANDANTKNAAVEYLNANIRYYTTHTVLPWNDTSITGCNSGGDPTAATLGAASMTGCLNALINDGEIKAGFTTATALLNSIIVNGSTNGVTACFQPQSKSQQKDPNTKYAANGTITSGCVSQTSGGATSCYWCSL